VTSVQTYDPRTGALHDTDVGATTAGEVADLCARAAAAAEELGDLDVWPLDRRAGLLRRIADRIDAHAGELAALADTETALGEPRLTGEITRTTGQLRLFAEAVDEGSFLEVIVDPADPTATPPRPDLRRMLQPIGPVGVFSASNFPFAFSVAGGDTAAALAAGCPVVVKAHSGHVLTSARVAALVADALDESGAPPGTFAVVYGREAGRLLVTDPAIKAVGFTGSLAGGRALYDLAVSRPDPIPFYGELGSLNPVVVTPAAVAARGPEIVAGFAGSFTLGAGQFCTKPGLLLLPAGHGLSDELAAAVADVPAAVLLTPAIKDGFGDATTRLAAGDDVHVLAGTPESSALAVPARLYSAPAAAIVADPSLLDECFGPAALVVEWSSEDDLFAVLDVIAGSLTATIHAEIDEPSDAAFARRLLPRLRRLAGRIVWNGWPTGVAVTWSMHHGGPWPATTNPLHTSVGVTSMRRFLVPVVYQNAPPSLLPLPLRDGGPLRGSAGGGPEGRG
jgi:NADP-dependent aldehyde dehydrogenase